MQRMKTVLVSIALVMAQNAVAASHAVEIAWGRDGAFVQGASVEPGKFVELCGKLTPADYIRWELTARVPGNFFIHDRVCKETEFPAKRAQVSSGRDTLRVAVHEDFCWMLCNKLSSRTRVDARLLCQN